MSSDTGIVSTVFFVGLLFDARSPAPPPPPPNKKSRKKENWRREKDVKQKAKNRIRIRTTCQNLGFHLLHSAQGQSAVILHIVHNILFYSDQFFCYMITAEFIFSFQREPYKVAKDWNIETFVPYEKLLKFFMERLHCRWCMFKIYRRSSLASPASKLVAQWIDCNVVECPPPLRQQQQWQQQQNNKQQKIPLMMVFLKLIHLNSSLELAQTQMLNFRSICTQAHFNPYIQVSYVGPLYTSK